MPTFLSDSQRRTLRGVVEALLPAFPANDDTPEALTALAAYDVLPAGFVEEALAEITDETEQGNLRLFLTLLELPPVNLLVTGRWGRFSAKGPAQRDALLRGWAGSRLPAARRGFQAVKRMAAFLFYSYIDGSTPNPTWQATGFPGPPGPQSDAPRPITPTPITADTTLEADVLIVGSGAGGGVVAGELAAAGYSVIVLEKGGYYAERDYTGRELEGNQLLYEKRGGLSTADLGIAVLAGATLGGGTVINWNTSLRPPDYVREEWARDIGWAPATSPDFDASLDAVEARLNVTLNESQPNRQNALLEQGATALGYDAHPIPRNVSGCEDCGFCHFGCPFGAKQSTLVTYLQDAYQQGARLVVQAHVDRITHQRGRVTGAVATVHNGEATHTLTVKAGTVVVAAGSIHTPALLTRSGLKNENIGLNLRLHPVVPAFGIYAEPVRTWVGAPQTRLVDTFANLDGQGYGARLEVSPGWPGLFALALPWYSGRQHKRIMAQLNHVASNITLVRDKFGGAVATKKDGQPELRYILHRYDAKHLMHGLLEGLKIHRAAGAQEIIAPHSAMLTWRPGEDFDGFLEAVEQEGLKPNSVSMFSAHQMSSARLGGSPRQGALKPTGETWEVTGLYVADGSALPNASGVNPMISIMGVAHYVAQQIKLFSR